MQDITPIIGEDVKIIESYGAGGFKVSDEKIDGTIFITAAIVNKLQSSDIDDTKLQNDVLALIENNQNDIEILLVGYGDESKFFSSDIEKKIKSSGVQIEYMNSGAAARTYNVLITEERKVAAILIAV